MLENENEGQDPLLTEEEACQHRNFCMKVEGDDTSPKFGQKVPDVDGFKRFVKATNFPFVSRSGREDGRNRLYRKSDLDSYIDGKALVNQPENSKDNITETRSSNESDTQLKETNTKIEIIKKAEELHQKEVELQAMRAGFKTAEEYKQALDALKEREDKLKVQTIALDEKEQMIEAREVIIDDREAHIEDVCNEKLADAENTCSQMVEEAKVKCEQLVANKKQELNIKEDTEYNNMEYCVHLIERMNKVVCNWGFMGVGEQIDVMLGRIIKAINGGATLDSVRGDFRYIVSMFCEVIETTQNSRDSKNYVDFRNQLGDQIRDIRTRLYLVNNKKSIQAKQPQPPPLG